ncbi:hypothetical protein GALL_503660 [mine drainage metagenome]|uniref:Uncharacterized protein n=1 Tax=mine drainage metagenome TaxID=410659 RepID=A0A1J5PBE7_9ZZZZ
MGAAEHIERLLEIAVVRECSPVARNEGFVAGMGERGLFEHGNRLGPLPCGPKRLAVLQRHVGVVGIGAKAITIEFYPVHGFSDAALLGFLTQRPRNVRHAIGLAAAKPQHQNRRQCCRRKKSGVTVLLERLRGHLLDL